MILLQRLDLWLTSLRMHLSIQSFEKEYYKKKKEFMSDKNPIIFLEHIIESIECIDEYLGGVSLAEFKSDKKTHDAVIRQLEIIGEAVKNLPEELRVKYTDLPWKEMAGLRDILIHHYFGVDLELTYEVVINDLKPIKEKIAVILNQLRSQ